MTGGTANIFDSISIGDIGSQGVSGDDLADIFGSLAEAERLKVAEREAERAAARQTLIIGGGLLYASILITIIYIIYKRRNS